MTGTRRLRSATQETSASSPPPPVTFIVSGAPSQIQTLRHRSPIPNLSPPELKLFRKKQKCLSSNAISTQSSPIHDSPIRTALAATLIFAQHEAGTAVCVHPDGWVLTCSHCFGESKEEWIANKRKWVLSYMGMGVLLECRVWDARRDLALAKIVTIECNAFEEGQVQPIFAFVALSKRALAVNTRIVCIGQPGAEDLEAEGNKKTKYNLVEVSNGRFRGLVQDMDPQDNSEIGVLKHDAWTYWGHSGAPLLREDDGMLVGLHSSWDDQTAMRHGIPHIAIREFLDEHMNRLAEETRDERISVSI